MPNLFELQEILKTPVAFLIFNRPELTARVFAAIAAARPPVLLMVADGPRDEHPNDKERTAAARAVIKNIDWPCEVLTNFSDRNLGCKQRVSSGLDWVFSQVEEAIILEDDCLPHPTFFSFCEELLERYRTDERIMTINGHNFLHGQRVSPYSYYFSAYAHIWGWASWRRAWKFYDIELKLWPLLRQSRWLEEIMGYATVAEYWKKIFDGISAGLFKTWDYQWLFACWAQNGLAIAPSVNLVSNIGFGIDSTHTARSDAMTSELAMSEIVFPLAHPPYLVRDRMADDYESRYVFKCALDDVGLKRGIRQQLAALVPPLIRRRARERFPGLTRPPV